ncbi:MAG: CooT family nickel-binding protein [Methanosarcinales archaeon]|nr:CooT family nickel-binding protein [Methanosarcinales archaeon]
MCELNVYLQSGEKRELIMDGVVRLVSSQGKVLLEGILGDSKEVPGELVEVSIISQEAVVASP